MKCGKPLVVVCILCLLASCSQRAKIVRREIRFGQDSAGVVGVMTFNIRYGSAADGDNHWRRRRELVFDVIADHAVDVIGLQEALYFQIQDIQRALPQYKIFSAGRKDGKREGEACPILYRRDRFSVADSGTFWFSNMPWRPGSKHWGNDLPRICTWVRLTEIASGESFYVYNVHLDHQSQDSRHHSMKLLAKEIVKRKHPDPVIVTGDFNMETDNPAMVLLQDMPLLPMADVWQSLHPGQPGVTTYQAFGGQSSGPCLDHIFIDEMVEIIEVAIDARTFDGRYPSDHFPVTAYLRVH